MIEIKKYKGNGYAFTLKAEDGGSLLNSITFASEDEVKSTVARLQETKGTQNIFERRTNHEGKFLFSMKDANGQLIGRSGLYSSEAGMENGIKNVRNRLSSLANH